MYELDDVDQSSPALLKALGAQCETLRKLKEVMEAKKKEAEEAERQYLEYARDTLPNAFKNCGLTSLTLEDGTHMNVTTQVRCTINKNEEDKKRVASFLESKGLGSLVSKHLEILDTSEDLKDFLIENDVPYEETMNMNTNQVKAALKEMLGFGTSMQTIKLEDLPKGLHMFIYDEMEVVK